MKGSTFRQGGLKSVVALTAFFLVLAQVARLPMACAQGVVARVASVQLTVEKRGGAAPFRQAAVGATLGVGDGLRTGKRSKADMKFADGSLLRLGQITSIEIQSTKRVRLSGGRLLYTALKPGRVLAGNGTAEILGSVAVIGLDRNNAGEFSLYSGVMDVSGDRTVRLLPGQSVTVDPQGHLSRVRRAAPFGYLNGELNPDLLTEPEPGPFTGGEVNERIREGADRTGIDQLLPLGNPIATGDNGVPRGQPFPTPFPTPSLAQSQRLRSERLEPLRDSLSSVAPPATPSLPWSRSGTTRPPLNAPLLQLAQVPSASRIITAAGQEIQAQAQQAPASASGASGNAATPSSGAASTSSVASGPALGLSAEDLLAGFDLDTRPALDHIDDVDRNRGSFFDGDARLVGAASDQSTRAYGARLRGFGALGKAYFEGTLMPLQLRRNGVSRDFSSVATAYLLLRDTRGEILIGRQRFVAGPTQAAFFGSMIRQGGRETMDAIRIQPRLRHGLQLQAAYIYDAFPKNLPFQIGGAQKGLYGRAALRRRGFSVGLNALRYTSGLGAGVSTTTGTTVDFTLPVVRNEVDFYGEVGRDPFRRRLTTLGLGFPGLYQRTNFDAFLEYAKLSQSSGAGGAPVGTPPTEVTLRVYKRIGRVANSIATLSHFGGGAGWSLSVGLSIGGSRDTRYGGLP